MSTVPQSVEGWHAGFLNLLPAIKTHARIRFRKLPAERRQDAIQEVIAAACVNYQLLAARSQLDVALPGPLADFAVRHVRTGRHVGGRQDAARDVLSSVAHRRHGVRVYSYCSHRSGEGTEGWQQVAIAERSASIPDTAAFPGQSPASVRIWGCSNVTGWKRPWTGLLE